MTRSSHVLLQPRS